MLVYRRVYGTSQFLHDSSYLLSEFLRLLPHQSIPDFPYQRSTSRPPKGAMCSKVKRPEGPADMFKYFQVSSKVTFSHELVREWVSINHWENRTSPSERKQINTKSTPLIFLKNRGVSSVNLKSGSIICVDAAQNPEKQMPKARGVPFSSKIQKRLLNGQSSNQERCIHGISAPILILQDSRIQSSSPNGKFGKS